MLTEQRFGGIQLIGFVERPYIAGNEGGRCERLVEPYALLCHPFLEALKRLAQLTLQQRAYTAHRNGVTAAECGIDPIVVSPGEREILASGLEVLSRKRAIAAEVRRCAQLES